VMSFLLTQLFIDVENANTAFIDLSFLYGSDPERSNSLRSMTEGKLKSTLDKRNRMFPFVSSAQGIRYHNFFSFLMSIRCVLTLRLKIKE